MKLVKIRFTAWRDKPTPPRPPAFQEQLDHWNTRIGVLSVAAASFKEQQGHANSEALQKSLARITDELQRIDADRMPLRSAEEAVAEAATRAASKHLKVGTFGYQVWNDDASTHIGHVVDEAGHYLPAQAVYAFEVIDTDPSLPEWAKKR